MKEGEAESGSICFRPVEAADIPAMAAIRAEEWETAEFWAVRIPLYLSGAHSPQQALPERLAIVALDGGRVVGFAAAHRTLRFGCDGEVQWVNVAADSRGRGVAAGLIHEVGLWLAGQCARRVCVNVEPENTVARRLYEACGAEPMSGRPHWMVWEDAGRMVARAPEN